MRRAFCVALFTVSGSTNAFRAPSLPMRVAATRPLVAWPKGPAAQSICATLARNPNPAKRSEPTAVYALLVANIGLFVADKVLRIGGLQRLYLYHSSWQWWQTVGACFCHASRSHLSGNVFLLLLFGRSVEDELGWLGLLVSYVTCGVAANLVSLCLLPSATVSLGASGAVFGLFAVSVLARLSWRDLDWRKVVEVAVLGEFVVGQVLKEARVAAGGGIAGINHVAHLSGAAAGVLLVLLIRVLLARFEEDE